jgi:hypothetical protein
VVAEAVDTVIDVFGEDETDNAAAHINLVEKLQALLPSLKHKVRFGICLSIQVQIAHNISKLF